MNNYDKNKELSYLHYYNLNNLYGWAILQKSPVNYFELIKDTSQFNENFIKIYNEEIDEENFLEIDNQYLQKLQKHYHGLPFLLKKMKIEKIEKFVANLNNKTEYVIPIRILKQALNHGLV